MNDLKRTIIEFCYSHNLSHLSSCLTAVSIIDEIYRTKKESEPFVLSQGHAGIALYTVLEKYYRYDVVYYFMKHGIHPSRGFYIEASTGSLGHGLPIAVGMALANPKKNVYCLISDGECDEGSIWEAFRIIEEKKIKNIKVYLNFNGSSAYRKINKIRGLPKFVKVRKTKVGIPLLEGIQGHYKVLTKDEKNVCLSALQ